jgi:hypothetical protein
MALPQWLHAWRRMALAWRQRLAAAAQTPAYHLTKRVQHLHNPSLVSSSSRRSSRSSRRSSSSSGGSSGRGRGVGAPGHHSTQHSSKTRRASGRSWHVRWRTRHRWQRASQQRSTHSRPSQRPPRAVGSAHAPRTQPPARQHHRSARWLLRCVARGVPLRVSRPSRSCPRPRACAWHGASLPRTQRAPGCTFRLALAVWARVPPSVRCCPPRQGGCACWV